MAHIVIMGAGIGGLPAAYEIREVLGKGHDITVINSVDYFSFVPSNPWVAIGWRKPDETTIPLAPYLEKKGIELIAQSVTSLDPDNNRLTVKDGTVVEYDYLVIATGPKLAFDEIEGLGPHGGHTHSICTLDHAKETYRAWQSFVEDPGPVVVGATQGASCFGPAYEFAFIVNNELRKRKIRDQVPMTYITSEPYIGHLGLGGVGDSKGMLESELRMQDIKWITNAKVMKVEEDKMYVHEYNDQGDVIKEHEVPHKFSMMIPAFKGIDPLIEVGEDLVNPRGFVKVDKYQRNPKWHNIYSVGVCIAIAPTEATPVPTGVPKTGYMIESMVTAVAHNIHNHLEEKELEHVGTWNAICLADMGDTGVAFVAMPQIPPRNVAWMKKGKWVHLAKVGFEKYFLKKMKSGTSETAYEKFVLKSLGIEKLK